MNLNPLKWFKKESATTKSRVRNLGSQGAIWSDKRYDVLAKESYLKNAIAFRCIFAIAAAIASVPWELFKKDNNGDKTKMDNNPVIDLIERPNPEDSFQFLMMKAGAYLVMSGNTYFESVAPTAGPNLGIPKELYILRPDRMQVLVDETTGRIKGYKHEANNVKTIFPIDQITGKSPILHCKAFHPLDDFYGSAITWSIAREIDTSNEQTEWNKKMLENEARPGAVFSYPDPITEQQWQRLEDMLLSRAGSVNAGKNLILEGGAKMTPYNWSPKEIDYIKGNREQARRIALGYGVPSELIGLPEEKTFSNFQEARQYFWEETVFFYLNYFKGELSNWFFGEDRSMFLDYNLDQIPAMAYKRDKMWKRAQESDFITINEKRQMVGKEDIEGGDVILVEASKIPLGAEMGEEDEEEIRQTLINQGYTEDVIDQMLHSIPKKDKGNGKSCNHGVTG
jgi:HK97 family phage portal protein